MSKKGGGGQIQSKLTHIYEFSQKKRNVISKNREGGGGKGRLGVFQKNIQIGESGHP